MTMNELKPLKQKIWIGGLLLFFMSHSLEDKITNTWLDLTRKTQYNTTAKLISGKF